MMNNVDNIITLKSKSKLESRGEGNPKGMRRIGAERYRTGRVINRLGPESVDGSLDSFFRAYLTEDNTEEEQGCTDGVKVGGIDCNISRFYFHPNSNNNY